MLPAECPSIHVSILPGADAALYRWVEVGAEEEGVPTNLMPCDASDLVSLAYQAALSSRLSIGVAISNQAVVLHERHMPPEQPVLTFNFTDKAPYVCRMIGSNAARMVVHRPLHIDIQFPPPSVKLQPVPPVKNISTFETEVDPALIIKIIAITLRKLQERGM
jgi:hypothetical protein